MLKWSKYNLVSDIESGMLLYNTATGNVIKVTDETYLKVLKRLIDNEVEEDTFNDKECEILNEFVQKKVLVDSKTNELDLLTYIYNNQITRNNILELTLIITRQCNYRCVYCYEEHLDLSMSKDVYQSILKLLEKVYLSGQYSGVSISLFGGEPLLEYDDVLEFLKSAYDISYKNDKTFIVSATTNGSLLFPERFLELHKLNCRHYQITIDGLKETHDSYRVATDNNGWDRIIENLKFMESTDLSFDVTLRTNFNDEILENVSEFYSFISKNFGQRFNIYYEEIKRLGGESDSEINVLDHVSANSSMVDIASMLKTYCIKSNVCSDRLLPFSHICQATKYNSFIIDYDGTLLKCTLDFNSLNNKIGRLTKDGDMWIDHEKHCKWLTVGFENITKCQKCKLLPLCFGRRCVSSALESKSLSCNPDLEEIFLMEQIKSYYCKEY